MDADVVLREPRGLVRGQDGRIYLTQTMTPEVLVLTPEGRPDTIIGRAGQGPGEFQWSADQLGWMVDTLWVSDIRTVHLFPLEAGSPGTIAFQTMGPDRRYIVNPMQPLADGSVRGRVQWLGQEGWSERVQPVLRTSRTGEIIDTLALAPQTYLRLGSRVGLIHPLYFLLEPQVAADGAALLLVKTDESGRDPYFTIVKLALTGDELLRRVVSYTPVPIPRDVATKLHDEYAEWLSRPPQGSLVLSDAMAERNFNEIRRAVPEVLPLPSFYPPVRRVIAGHDGSIWLLREPQGPAEDRWEVYSDGGELEAVVDLPAGRWWYSRFSVAPRTHVLRAGRDEVWIAALAQLDVPYLTRYEIIRGC